MAKGGPRSIATRPWNYSPIQLEIGDQAGLVTRIVSFPRLFELRMK
jgi:hypothetical protein